MRVGSDTLKAGVRNGPVFSSAGSEGVDGMVEFDGDVYFTVQEQGANEGDGSETKLQEEAKKEEVKPEAEEVVKEGAIAQDGEENRPENSEPGRVSEPAPNLQSQVTNL